jgi:hypothetical protein
MEFVMTGDSVELAICSLSEIALNYGSRIREDKGIKRCEFAGGGDAEL